MQVQWNGKNVLFCDVSIVKFAARFSLGDGNKILRNSLCKPTTAAAAIYFHSIYLERSTGWCQPRTTSHTHTAATIKKIFPNQPTHICVCLFGCLLLLLCFAVFSFSISRLLQIDNEFRHRDTPPPPTSSLFFKLTIINERCLMIELSLWYFTWIFVKKKLYRRFRKFCL